MCGIAGIYHCGTIKPVDPARVERMCDALVHRGPDDSGVWTAPGVGLGFRRLAIIDLAGSPQPMRSADGRAVLVFNGEIYNFRELRRELAALGATFRTDGDGEVILAAWRRRRRARQGRIRPGHAHGLRQRQAGAERDRLHRDLGNDRRRAGRQGLRRAPQKTRVFFGSGRRGRTLGRPCSR
jgi:asparagine synthase (glutamine-hydrolysing)